MREILPYSSKMIRLSTLAVQGAALAAAWAIWKPLMQGLLPLALVYVLAAWIVAAGITLGTYLAVSVAPLSNLLAASWEDSPVAMWLVPGALLVASRPPLGAAAGLALVVNSTWLLASSRAPRGESIPARRRVRMKSGPLLFSYQQQPGYFSLAVLMTMVGALMLQAGIYALTAAGCHFVRSRDSHLDRDGGDAWRHGCERWSQCAVLGAKHCSDHSVDDHGDGCADT
jgi:hypothetical protein